jgi:hypothetical protein
MEQAHDNDNQGLATTTVTHIKHYYNVSMLSAYYTPYARTVSPESARDRHRENHKQHQTWQAATRARRSTHARNVARMEGSPEHWSSSIVFDAMLGGN